MMSSNIDEGALAWDHVPTAIDTYDLVLFVSLSLTLWSIYLSFQHNTGLESTRRLLLVLRLTLVLLG